MLRLSLLTIAAVLLPAAGNKPAAVMSSENIAPTVSASWAPKIRLPRFPKFNRKHGNQIEMAQIKQRLRNLVVLEEQFYSDNGVYGRDVNRMNSKSAGDSASSNHVQVQILWAGKRGWSAIASHPDAPGKSCTIYVGDREKFPILPRTRAEGIEASMEGIPACDK
jgi:hypothetical protein